MGGEVRRADAEDRKVSHRNADRDRRPIPEGVESRPPGKKKRACGYGQEAQQKKMGCR
jgi:hypothetical protein